MLIERFFGQIRVDLGVMAMNEYYRLSRFPELESHHQILFCVIPKTFFFWWGRSSLQGIQSAYSKLHQ